MRLRVIGDGAMSAGMAFEAMNNAGHLKKRLIVVLNDNEMSIAPPVGALSSYLSRLYAGEPFQELKAAAKGAVSCCPNRSRKARVARKSCSRAWPWAARCLRSWASATSADRRHDLDQLLPLLRTVKARATGPVLIHVLTKKGKGYGPAESAREPGDMPPASSTC